MRKLVLILLLVINTSFACTYCSMIDDAWKEMGDTNVYVPGTGIMPYIEAYPPPPPPPPPPPEPVSSSSTGSSGSYSSGSVQVSSSAQGWQGCVADLGADTDKNYKFEALLDSIAWAEGSHYNTIVGYDDTPWDCQKGHPSVNVFIPGLDLSSNAAGRYQFVKSTYDGLREKGEFQDDFCDRSQDKAALKLATQAGLKISDLENGISEAAATALAPTWASWPYFEDDCRVHRIHCTDACRHVASGALCGSGYSYYGQPTKTLDKLNEVYEKCLNQRRNPGMYAGKKVVMIGASHTVNHGAYGGQLERYLKDSGAEVYRYAVSGSSGWSWAQNDFRGLAISGTISTPGSTENFEESSRLEREFPADQNIITSIESTINPDIYIISLGTNFISATIDDSEGSVNRNVKPLDQATNGKTCYWVGPSYVGSDAQGNYASLIGQEERAVAEFKSAVSNCKYIDLLEITTADEMADSSNSGDAIHYTAAYATKIVNYVTQEMSS